MVFRPKNKTGLYFLTIVIVLIISVTDFHRIFSSDSINLVPNDYWAGQQASYDEFNSLYRYSEVQHVFDACDDRTVVTFDVDDTLITANDVFARTAEPPLWFKICLTVEHLASFIKKEKREKVIDDYLGVFFPQVPRFVFDSDIVQLIKHLQQQKSTVVGLTAIGTGSVGTIKSLPEWRANMLKDFGIDLSSTFTDASFTNLPANRNNYPCFYRGILCANYVAKGDVLGAFLDYYHLKPERIVSFDDQERSLISIAQECKKRDIPFFGYQVLATKKLPGKWNTKRALLQFDTALKHNLWLSDSQADAVLAGEKELLA